MTKLMTVPCVAGLLLATTSSLYAADGAGDVALEEVIVTAQRTTQNVQKASIDIKVLSSDAITSAGVTDPSTIANVMPGVNIAMAGAVVQTFVRGVGSFGTNSYADSAIAYSIDGNYIARPTALGGVFFDLERIEVLKGPQGTLYGRNASGGAINLITKKPTQDMAGEVNVESGNYNLVKTNGALNLPVSDTVAVRTAFQMNRRDGYATGGYYDDDTRGVRMQGLFTPSDAVSVLLSVDAAHIGGKGATGVRLSSNLPYSSDPWHERVANAPQGQPAYLQSVPWAGDLNKPDDSGKIDTHVWNASAELDVKMDWATLTLQPAYRSMNSHQRIFSPGFLFTNDETSQQKTLEARLANSSDRLTWVGGVYYFREDQTQHFFVDQGVNTTEVTTPVLDTKSYAGFGQATFSVTEPLRVIVGARYTHESKIQQGIQKNLSPYPTFVYQYNFPAFLKTTANYVCGTTQSAPPFAAPVICQDPVQGEVSASKFTWRTGLEYDVSANSMAFLTASTGFKAGGVFNSKKSDPTYKPEELLAIEGGMRNRLFGNRLQVNASAFYWDYKDKQEASVRVDPIDGTGFIIRNASKAQMTGANIDIVWKLTANDRVSLFTEYVKSKYKDFKYVVSTGSASTAPNSTCAATLVNASAGNWQLDCTDKSLPKAPDWTGDLSYEHVFALASGASITAAARAAFSSEVIQDISYAKLARMGGYTTYDANVSYQPPNQVWSVTAWGRNLGNKAIYTGGSLYPFAPDEYYSTIQAPRTFGARLAVKF